MRTRSSGSGSGPEHDLVTRKSQWLLSVYRKQVIYSIILIVHGALCIAFNVAVIAMNQIIGGDIGFGIWSGCFSIVTGCLGLVSARLKIYKLLVANIVVSVFCAIVSAVASVFSISDIVHVRNTDTHTRYINIDLSLSVVMCALIFVLCVGEIIAVIMLSINFCRLWSKFDYHYIIEMFHHHHAHHHTSQSGAEGGMTSVDGAGQQSHKHQYFKPQSKHRPPSSPAPNLDPDPDTKSESPRRSSVILHEDVQTSLAHENLELFP